MTAGQSVEIRLSTHACEEGKISNSSPIGGIIEVNNILVHTALGSGAIRSRKLLIEPTACGSTERNAARFAWPVWVNGPILDNEKMNRVRRHNYHHKKTLPDAYKFSHPCGRLDVCHKPSQLSLGVFVVVVSQAKPLKEAKAKYSVCGKAARHEGYDDLCQTLENQVDVLLEPGEILYYRQV